jgi:hypothetical protein
MDKRSVIEIFFGLLGMFLANIGINARSPFLAHLGSIGIWIVIITPYWHYYRIRKEAREQGKNILY